MMVKQAITMMMESVNGKVDPNGWWVMPLYAHPGRRVVYLVQHVTPQGVAK